MPEQIETHPCTTGKISATFHMPVTACISDIDGDAPGGMPLKTWESGWFQPETNKMRRFFHWLNLESPWLCEPLIVGKVHTAQAGWLKDEIIFTHCSDFYGNTANKEVGWLTSVAQNECRVVFGNAAQFVCAHRDGGYGVLNKANVHCNLVIRY